MSDHAHSAIIVKEKNHHCEVCGASFTTAQSKSRHLKIHTGEMNHSCDGCGEAFSRTDYMRIHMSKCKQWLEMHPDGVLPPKRIYNRTPGKKNSFKKEKVQHGKENKAEEKQKKKKTTKRSSDRISSTEYRHQLIQKHKRAKAEKAARQAAAEINTAEKSESNTSKKTEPMKTEQQQCVSSSDKPTLPSVTDLTICRPCSMLIGDNSSMQVVVRYHTAELRARHIEQHAVLHEMMQRELGGIDLTHTAVYNHFARVCFTSNHNQVSSSLLANRNRSLDQVVGKLKQNQDKSCNISRIDGFDTSMPKSAQNRSSISKDSPKPGGKQSLSPTDTNQSTSESMNTNAVDMKSSKVNGQTSADSSKWLRCNQCSEIVKYEFIKSHYVDCIVKKKNDELMSKMETDAN